MPRTWGMQMHSFLCHQRQQKRGVQGTKSLAEVWGVPTTLFFLPPQAAQKTK